jgi:hypothetical protein
LTGGKTIDGEMIPEIFGELKASTIILQIFNRVNKYIKNNESKYSTKTVDGLKELEIALTDDKKTIDGEKMDEIFRELKASTIILQKFNSLVFLPPINYLEPKDLDFDSKKTINKKINQGVCLIYSDWHISNQIISFYQKFANENN